MSLFVFATLVASASASRHVSPVHFEAQRGAESVTSLEGSLLPMGVFYTTIDIGGRPFNVTVDTGSTDLLVPIDGCDGCVPTAPAYQPKSDALPCTNTSSLLCKSCVENAAGERFCSFYDSYLTCDLSNLTATCSVSGKLYRDDVTLGKFKASSAVFGGITKQSSNFDQFKKVDGILGLAYSSMGFSDSVFETAVKQNSIPNVLQHCLTKTGGLLVYGASPEEDASFYEGDLMWTPITLEAWYTVNATDLRVGGASLNLSKRAINGPFSDPCIVDSGTNFLSLTTPAFRATISALRNAHVSEAFLTGKTIALDPAAFKTWPNVTIVLAPGDVVLNLTPEEYVVPTTPGAGTYRIGITEGDCIIGNTHMLRYWTVYDRQNKRIGFAEAKRKSAFKSFAVAYKSFEPDIYSRRVQNSSLPFTIEFLHALKIILSMMIYYTIRK